MELNQIYKQLTSVDIIEQKQIWDERGKGYYGEYLLFCELYKNIEGCCKILMNLEIPTANGRKTEIDLLMIHETGLYVFEVKHYKGTIYGKDTDSMWTQYFRTTSNSVFKNPILQNGYHIRALKHNIPDTPIRSFIVFTNDECDIRVTNSNSEISICTLYTVCRKFNEMAHTMEKRFSMDEINATFNKLSVYSKMKEPVIIDGKEADFCAWIEPAISEFESEKKKYSLETEKAKKKARTSIITSIILSAVFVIGSLASALYEQMRCRLILLEAEAKIKEFIEEYSDKNSDSELENRKLGLNVTNVSIKTSSNNCLSFSACLVMSDDEYGIALTEKSQYIVTTKSGQSYTYNVFGEHLKYNRDYNIVGKGIRSQGNLAKIEFKDISKSDDISNIKINNIEIFKLSDTNTPIKNNVEIILYSANSEK